MFLGYPFGVKGYKVYDLSTHTTFISRDVVFHETVFPFSSFPSIPSFDISSSDLVLPIPLEFEQSFSSSSPPLNETTSSSSSSQIAPSTRKSTRSSKAPTYLQDYHCNLASSSSTSSTISTYTPHPNHPHDISHYLSYTKLSTSHKAFTVSISSHHETEHYHQAVHHPQWQEAMAYEIKALEDNHTWTLVSLPPNKQPIG